MSRSVEIVPDPYEGLEPWEDPVPSAIQPDACVLNALNATLTEAQREAAAQAGPILVLAGAGSGKTLTLTAAVLRRIATDGFLPDRILAVTFTNKAAKEMTSRIRAVLGASAAPSWIGTYHGLGARQLRQQPEIAELRPGFDILDADDSKRFVKRTMKALNLAAGDEDLPSMSSSGRDPLKLICNRISSFKDRLLTPQGSSAAIEKRISEATRTGAMIDALGLRTAARVYAHYQRALRDANAADFGDLLLWPTLTMQRDENYRDLWASRFDCLLADEYQDVNFAQYSWLKALAADHKRLFVVGDDDQAIYSWRGSDIAFIRRFVRDFPNAPEIRLEENFRSTGHILSAANTVIAKDRKRLGKTLYTRKDQGELIEILSFHDAQTEADAIAAEIQRRQAQGTPWQDIAILYRNNFLSRSYEEALMRAHVPYVIVGDVGFYQRAEIKDALAYLRLSVNPDERQSDEAFRRIINEPRRGFGTKALQILEDEANFRNLSLLRAIDTAPLPSKARATGLAFADTIRRIGQDPSHTLADQISLLLDGTGYRAMLRDSKAETNDDRLENLAELLSIAGSFHTARELLDHAALATSRPYEDDTARVRLMTLHKAKGLEFPQVFLPAWEAGILPSDYSDPEEERRLAYVALTRAMRRITITSSAFRRGPAMPSPFIEDIPENCRINGWLNAGSYNVRRPLSLPAPTAAFARRSKGKR